MDALPAAFRSRMQRLLGSDANAFFDSYHLPLRRGVRANTLKCPADKLRDLFPGKLSPCPFSPDAFVLLDHPAAPHRAGADPLHHAGAYYMQEPSALSAVAALRPQPGERVLDLCAAPGGKTTQIAAAMRGRGLLWANEFVRSRAQALMQNLERCGVRNAVVSSADPPSLCGRLNGWFDAVLVDAPCSGEGMFRKEPAALAQWSEQNIALCAARQDGILLAAADAVAPGGRLVYSTCTFAPEENEGAIARLLAARPDFTLVDPGVSFGRPGFDWERVAPFLPGVSAPAFPLSLCRRILPGDGGEGHFFALLVREGTPPSLKNYAGEGLADNTISNLFCKLYESCFCSPPWGDLFIQKDRIRLLAKELPPLDRLPILAAGVSAADRCKDRLEPCHALFMAAAGADDCVSCLDLAPDDPRLAAFLRGETVEAPGCAGWTAVAVAGIVTGFGKVSGGVLKNRYPKGLRLRG